MSLALKLLALAACLACLPAQAAFQGYLRIEGIDGESRDPGREGWSDVRALISDGQRAVASGPFAGRIGFVKPMDQASPLIFQAATQHSSIEKITLDFVVVSDGVRELWRLVLSGCRITSIKTEQQGDAFIETIAIDYQQLTSTYYELGGVEHVVTYDQAEQTSTTFAPPSDPDPDSDGIPTVYEIDNGLNNTANDAREDKDGDGLTNYEEYIFGTRADTGSSLFTLRVEDDGAHYSVVWDAIPGRQYAVRYSSDLSQPFATLQTLTTDIEGEIAYPVSAPYASGFFRIEVSE